MGAWQRPAGFAPIGLYNNGFGNRVTGISLNGNYTFSQDPGYVPNGPLDSNPTYTLKDNVTKVMGPHNFQFGGYVVIAQKNEIPQPSTGTSGILTFDSTNGAVEQRKLLCRSPSGNPVKLSAGEGRTQDVRAVQDFEPYLQDDWHVNLFA